MFARLKTAAVDITTIQRKLEQQLTCPVAQIQAPSDHELRIHLKLLKTYKGALMVVIKKDPGSGQWKGDMSDPITGFIAAALNA